MAVQRLRVVTEAPQDGTAPLDVYIDGLPSTVSTPCAAVPDVSGDDAASVKTTLNALLASLRSGNVIASE